MKKITVKILLILSLFGLIGVSFSDISYAAASTTSSKGTGTITVIVTEKIPGAGCDIEIPIMDKKGKQIGTNYKCTVKKGFGSVVKMMGAMIKYFTFLAGLGGVLYLVINGIMYSMGGMDEALKTKAKEAISKTLMGLVILFLSGVILNIIAPWIYK